MQLSPVLVLLAAAASAIGAPCQYTAVAPNGYAAVPGSTNNAWPWMRAGAPMRYQQIHSGTNFTLQGANVPVLISRLRFRAAQNQSPASWPGGSWSNVAINMSTAATTYLTASSTFANNHGADLRTVYTGPVTVLPGVGAAPGVPGPIYIDIPLTTPFAYDPNAGDLCYEVILDGVGWSGTSAATDTVAGTYPAGPALGTRILSTVSHTAPTGTVQANGVLVTEFTWAPQNGHAFSSAYGAGCQDRAQASFYQLFGNGTFNLSNSSIQMIPTGSGYIVVPGGSQWWPPVAGIVALTDNSVSTHPLGFTFPYAFGSTIYASISSNGYVWLRPNTNPGCCTGSPSDLLSMGARICPLWTDLNPAAGGSVQFSVDGTGSAAYVTFTNVPEQGAPANLNTFQIALHATGMIEMRWRNCRVTNHAVLTGWSPGSGAFDPGSVNLLTSLPITLNPDANALVLRASGRPVMGSSIDLVTFNISAGSPLGAVIFSNTQHDPGLDLSAIGMPGCRQYTGLDFSVVFPVASPTVNFALGIPTNPVLSGMWVGTQVATFTPGFNPLGVLATNGVRLRLDLQ